MASYEEEARKMTPPQLAAVTAVGVCLAAFIVKLLLARSGGSLAVSAAAWHVAAGLLYALLMLGILHSPAEEPVEEDVSEAEREYLQYQSGITVNIKRHEAVLALAGSMGLMAVAYLIFNRVLAAKEAEPQALTVSLIGLGLVFFAMQFLGRFTERIGVEHETPGLVATSFHARTDAFATLLAAVALVTVAMGFRIERYFAALIGLLLVADAAQLFVDATRRIVGLEEDSPTEQVPFWVRLREALRAYAEDMPPIIRWLLRYEDAMSPEELRNARRWATVVVVAVYLLTGFKTIQLGQVGGVKYLGSYHGLAQPGPIYALWPFSTVRIVPVDRLQRVTVGFTSARSWAPHQEDRPFGEMLWGLDNTQNSLFTIDPEASKFMLGDTTQVETHVALTYTVRHDKVGRYLFAFEHPEELVQRATQQAIQELMLIRSLEDVIVEKRSDLETLAAARVQATLDRLDAGIVVEKCMIRSVHPPVEVLDSFVDVASALEDKARDINEAEGYRRRTEETSRGEADRLFNAAEAERVQRVSDARGQTAEYRQVYAAAAAAPEAVRERLTIETWEKVLTGKKKVIVPRAAGRARTQLWFSSGAPAAAVPGAVPQGAAQPPAPAGGEAPAAEGAAEGGEAGGAGQAGADKAAAGAPAGH